SFGRYALLVLLGSVGTLALSPHADFPFRFHEPALAEGARLASDETLELTGLEQQFEAIAQQVSGSVVAISAATSSISDEQALRADELNGDRLASYLDGKTRIVGTGFIID